MSQRRFYDNQIPFIAGLNPKGSLKNKMVFFTLGFVVGFGWSDLPVSDWEPKRRQDE